MALQTQHIESMQCGICSRRYVSKLPFNCTTCARNALYELRLENASVLVDKEALGRQVEASISLNSSIDTGRAGADVVEQSLPRNSNRMDIEQATAQKEESLERIQEIQNQANILRKDIESSRAHIAKLKASLAHRRSDYDSITHNLAARRATTLDSVEKSIRRIDHRWNTLHTRTAEARVFLCREAANLYGLKQRRRRKGGVVREDYTICGVTIVDLRDLNSKSNYLNIPPTFDSR
jgi:chromosome segregation ATPase